MTPPLPVQAATRLVFVRFLHRQGTDQARLPYPMCATAILSLHDAIELFYVVGLNHVGEHPDPKTGFEQLGQLLAKKVPNLTGLREMGNLNRIRVGLKHHGSIPGARQVADAQIDVETFLAVNTPLVFGRAWRGVTMVDVVPQQDIRAMLEAARTAVQDGKLAHAMGVLAKTFDRLFNPQSHAQVADAPLKVGEFIPKYHGVDKTAIEDLFRSNDSPRRPIHGAPEFARQLSAVMEATAAMQEALRVMALGIEYVQYLRFQQLTPRLVRIRAVEPVYEKDYAPTQEQFEVCEQFVIHAALRVAEVTSALEVR